jgi:DEAD/DEAH box helicase domain-containing protein
MLPAHLAENIRKQILFYLQSTFAFRDESVEKAFERFLNDPESGLFKGPWVQLKRPFRRADDNAEIPFDIDPGRHPFLHQWRAWKRLSTKKQTPQPTIVTTGTGSGKTECFLFPILDHCLRMRQLGQKGIKAIILYPMNALASDQERRFAKTVIENNKLFAARIRVGNYTGRYDPADPGASADGGTRTMGFTMADDGASAIYHGITNHAVQQEDPPDILLTNYKMLDFLLLRPQDQNLWRFNSPGVLQFLVMDELHTYDGAQGSDVACLIRRLKERLEIPQGQLCVVGTSATLDDRDPRSELQIGLNAASNVDAVETSSDRLARFASTLFEENITAEAVIGEDRLTVEEIVRPDVQEVVLPTPDDCLPLDDEDAMAFAMRQSVLWGGPTYQAPPSGAFERDIDQAHDDWAVALGEWLKTTRLFKYLLEVFEKTEAHREPPVTWMNLVEKLKQDELGFLNIKEFDQRSTVVGSFFALVAHAKELRSGIAFPLVPTQVQLWIRELRRLGRIVEERPAFIWLDEPLQDRFSLPTFHCSECGESGWIALHDTGQDSAIQARGVDGIQLDPDPSKIYNGWFGYKGNRSQHIVVISPWPKPQEPPEETDDLWDSTLVQKDLGFTEPRLRQKKLKVAAPPTQLELGMREEYLCPKSLVLRFEDGPCPLTGDPRRFRVKVSRQSRKDETNGATHGDQRCPNCQSSEGVFFIGSQSATLSSVAIDEMFGSVLNSDPKLLAFTDSVQDASHRAGFFTSRTYHFTFRTALQHLIDGTGTQGVPLSEVGQRLIDYWSDNKPQRLKNVKEAIGALLPSDLQQYPEWLEFRDSSSATTIPASLRTAIERRLTWEATSEFGLMQTHGRTLEASGSSCLGWDMSRIDATVDRLRQRLPGLDPAFANVSDEVLQLWLFGWLHRFRLRGALDHPYLEPLATKGFWGKFPFGRVVPDRETFPSRGHYMPKLMVTQREKSHDYVLAATSGNLSPWHLIWTRRALNVKNADDTAVLDLIQAMLVCGAQSQLFRQIHQDGNKQYYAIAASAALLFPYGTHLVCSQSQRSLIRPDPEADLWRDSPSAEYYADNGIYDTRPYTSRQIYYQQRYRKGALRRVVSREHTGLLATEEREQLERDFSKSSHSDDPNVLTCTSTLEMGIDIGDLSSTMLCSIPPTTASYLQRIGRAGRATGTALIISVVNQRPHDLFFYGRPAEMLRGRVDPPGCWLDASAVLVRQYLAYCIDSASKTGNLRELPRTGKQFLDDLNRPDGHFNKMLAWVTMNEADLRAKFLHRFHSNVLSDTRDRFALETTTELISQRIYQAVNEFARMLRDLENARKRLQTQLQSLDPTDDDARREIDQELYVLKGRTNSLGRTSALEILTDNGLLPNYAFPERGVRFYGSIYNKNKKTGQEHQPIEIIRPAGVALKELAPANHFYTHSRKFDIQQIAIGNSEDPLIELWAICGECGHMRSVEELKKADTSPACPQCGHDSGNDTQADQGQQRAFIEFSRSQSLSQMEHYESLSGDRDEERQRAYYQTIRSFDLTADAPTGAVGDEDLPFGIEYRASAVMREINVGYQGDTGVVAFGAGQNAPLEGFQICDDCGVAVPPNTLKAS